VVLPASFITSFIGAKGCALTTSDPARLKGLKKLHHCGSSYLEPGYWDEQTFRFRINQRRTLAAFGLQLAASRSWSACRLKRRLVRNRAISIFAFAMHACHQRSPLEFRIYKAIYRQSWLQTLASKGCLVGRQTRQNLASEHLDAAVYRIFDIWCCRCLRKCVTLCHEWICFWAVQTSGKTSCSTFENIFHQSLIPLEFAARSGAHLG